MKIQWYLEITLRAAISDKKAKKILETGKLVVDSPTLEGPLEIGGSVFKYHSARIAEETIGGKR